MRILVTFWTGSLLVFLVIVDWKFLFKFPIHLDYLQSAQSRVGRGTTDGRGLRMNWNLIFPLSLSLLHLIVLPPNFPSSSASSPNNGSEFKTGTGSATELGERQNLNDDNDEIISFPVKFIGFDSYPAVHAPTGCYQVEVREYDTEYSPHFEDDAGTKPLQIESPDWVHSPSQM